MGTVEFMFWVKGFWKRTVVYALPNMLRLWGLSCICTICGWCELAMVIVVGSLILIGVSMVIIMTYVWGLATDMTKLVSCVVVSLQMCDMMCEPSGVGISVGGPVAYFVVMLLVDER